MAQTDHSRISLLIITSKGLETWMVLWDLQEGILTYLFWEAGPNLLTISSLTPFKDQKLLHTLFAHNNSYSHEIHMKLRPLKDVPHVFRDPDSRPIVSLIDLFLFALFRTQRFNSPQVLNPQWRARPELLIAGPLWASKRSQKVVLQKLKVHFWHLCRPQNTSRYYQRTSPVITVDNIE